MPSYNIVYVHNCEMCKKNRYLVGGGQLLGNDDDVMVPPGYGLPVGSDYNVWFMRYVFLKKNVYFVFCRPTALQN